MPGAGGRRRTVAGVGVSPVGFAAAGPSLEFNGWKCRDLGVRSLGFIAAVGNVGI